MLNQDQYQQFKDKGVSDERMKSLGVIDDTTLKSFSGSSDTKDAGNAVTNFIPSAINVAKGIGSAVMHPLDTAETIAKTAVGGVEAGINTVAGTNIDTKATKTFTGVANYFKDRYGSWDNVVKTVNKDPAGFLLDVSSLLDAGGSVLGKVGDIAQAGKAGEISKIGLVGDVAKGIGKAIDPIQQGAKLSGSVIGKAGEVGSKFRDVAFGVSTGKGTETVRQAFEAGKEGGEAQSSFSSAMRGTTTPEQIVQESKGAIGELYKDRTAQYEADAAKLKTKEGVESLSTQGTKTAVKDSLKDMIGKDKVREYANPDGTTKLKIDFSENPGLNAPKWQKVADTVYNWKNTTIEGVNKLKQSLKDFKEGGVNLSPADAKYNKFVEDSIKNIDGYLKDNVEGYAQMNKNYSQATQNLKEITEAIDSKKPQLAFQRLTQALKTDNDFKIQLLEKVKKQTGVDLSKAVAGANLKTFMPGGLIGRSADAAVLLTKGLTGIFNPATLTEMAATSPRLVGEALQGLGVAKRYADMTIEFLKDKTPDQLNNILKTGYYASQANSPSTTQK